MLTLRTISQHHGRRFFSGAVTAAYEKHVENASIRRDADQLSLALKLDALYDSLEKSDSRVLAADQLPATMLTDVVPSSRIERTRHFLRRQVYKNLIKPLAIPNIRGLYIHGTVGVGKSFLMDLFFSLIQPKTVHRKAKRVHFHAFMLDFHRRCHHYRQQQLAIPSSSSDQTSDPIPAVAWQLAQESRLLCFDEFQVTDIGDAMVLQRLFTMLLDAGVVVVATSNRAPHELYSGGINRSHFLPFVDTLQESLEVFEMKGQTDYRRTSHRHHSANLTSSSNDDARSTDNNNDSNSSIHMQETGSFFFFWPIAAEETRQALQSHWHHALGEQHAESIPVMMGRSLDVQYAKDTVAWMEFAELCQEPLGAADYLALCQRFDTLIVDSVPQLSGECYNEARRFVTLIDALYETRTKLIFAAQVPLDHLFVGFDATVQTNDGDEEIAVQGIDGQSEQLSTNSERSLADQQDPVRSFVTGQGGSSSSFSTTMIRTKEGELEWSATGRIGVSLAQLSAVKDVAFSFKRAESRLAEMSRETWGR